MTNQKLVLRQLQILGYRADLVANGQAAVEAIQQLNYDIVLMDCQMPILNGFEATLSIRDWEHRHPRSCQTIVIAMTASNLEQDRLQAMAIGMNDYVTKPLRKEVLASLLDRWSQVIWTKTNLAVEPATSLLGDQSIEPEPLPPPNLDWTHLHRLSDNTSDFELELLQIFLENSQIHLKVLQQAVFNRDFQQIQQSAHYIKGASATIGAKQMQWLAEKLEHQPDLNSDAVVVQLITKLESSLNQVQDSFNRMKAGDRSMSILHTSVS